MNGEHVYVLPPIDYFEDRGWTEFDYRGGLPGGLLESAYRALRVISTHPFYEDEIRSSWAMPLPTADYEGMCYAVALKIDNNGTTFIWSPCELPWLSEWIGLTPTAIAALDRAQAATHDPLTGAPSTGRDR